MWIVVSVAVCAHWSSCNSIFCSQCSNRETTGTVRRWESPWEQHGCSTTTVVLGCLWTLLASDGPQDGECLGSEAFGLQLCFWARGRWAGGVSISRWLRTLYFKLLKTWSDPVLYFSLLPYLSQDYQQYWEPVTLSVRITFDIKQYKNIGQHYCPILQQQNLSLFWLFQCHVWYFEMFLYRK